MIRLELPYLPPASFSPNARCHWSVRNRDNEMVKNNVFFLLREQFATIPMLKRAKLHYTVVVPDKRRRDEDNFRAATKPVTDALVKSGLILDDSPQYIIENTLTFEYRKRTSATIIEIEEVKNGQI